MSHVLPHIGEGYRELLEALKETPGQESLANGSLNAVEVGALSDAHLITMVGFDFRQLLDERWVVCRKTSKPGEGFSRLLVLILLNEEAWSLRQEYQAYDNDDAPRRRSADVVKHG